MRELKQTNSTIKEFIIILLKMLIYLSVVIGVILFVPICLVILICSSVMGLVIGLIEKPFQLIRRKYEHTLHAKQ